MNADFLINQLKTKLSEILTVPENELSIFLEGTSIKYVKKNRFLIFENDVCSEVYFICQGAFRTFLKIDVKELNTEFFFENSFASAFTSFLTGNKTTLCIQALEDSIVISIPKHLLEEYYKKNPEWFALGKYLFEAEFIKKCKRESEFLRFTALQRYQSLVEVYPNIEKRVPGYHIASYLGIHPESLSRIRSSKIF